VSGVAYGLTCGAETLGAEGRVGLVGTGLRSTKTTTMMASTMTTLMTTMSAIGTLRLPGAEAAGLAAGGAGGSATTGAGARLIMRVKSLGPCEGDGAAAPPSGESGVALPDGAKIGGGRMAGVSSGAPGGAASGEPIGGTDPAGGWLGGTGGGDSGSGAAP
jgi:hypothetical protein